MAEFKPPKLAGGGALKPTPKPIPADTPTGNHGSSHPVGITRPTTPVEFVTSDELPESQFLHVASFGTQRSGKSRFGFTAFEVLDKRQKIAVLPIDINSEKTWRELEKEDPATRGRVLYPKTPLYTPEDIKASRRYAKIAGLLSRKTNSAKSNEEKEQQAEAQGEVCKVYRVVMNRIADTIEMLSGMDEVGLIVPDTFTEIYEFAQYADFGKIQGNDSLNWASINKEMIDLINMCRFKHFLLVHRAGEEWKTVTEQGVEKRKRTDRVVIDGWNKVGALANVVIEHMKIDDRAKDNALRLDWGLAQAGVASDDSGLPETPYFVIRPYESQSNAWLTRKDLGDALINEDCTWAKLGEKVYRDENWWKG